MKWQTLNKINYPPTPFNSNDTISFKCGTRIYGQCLIPPNDNLVFNSYGTGARPVIDGSTDTLTCMEITKSNINVKGIKFVNGHSADIGFDGYGSYPTNIIIDQI